MRQTVIPIRERGAALMVSLILLLILTLLGLSSVQNTTLQERMAGNYRSSVVAFEAAESALREGETGVDGYLLRPTPSTSGKVKPKDAPDPDASTTGPWWKEADAGWWTTNGEEYSGTLKFLDVTTGGELEKPRYVVEELGLVKDSLNVGQSQDETGRWFYQVTARARGVNENTVSLLRSTYARRY